MFGFKKKFNQLHHRLLVPEIILKCVNGMDVVLIKNIFYDPIVNLSIADAMVSTLNTTLNFVYMLNSDWPFGTLFCKVSQFVASLSICASVFTLMAIAIDR